ncbi:MAG: DUF4265 domain-containing protein [Acidobacteria bacterium]|nr:DUF4265 domain-containing protein [Acidobacteriota bacterium]
MTDAKVKIHFEIEQDEDGYPEMGVESLWAHSATGEGVYAIDNIPFYVLGISMGDEVSVQSDDSGNLWFYELVRESGHSTVRILCADTETCTRIQAEIERRGCSWEGSNRRFISMDIPPDVSYPPIKSWLEDEEQKDI